MFQDWLELYKKIHTCPTNKGTCLCPECGSQTIDMQFVGDEKSRVGYLCMWCETCKKGIHISRVIVPQSEPMMYFDTPNETIEERIPNFKQITPK